MDAIKEHPRVFKNGVFNQYDCCSLRVGLFGCCRSKTTSDFETWGLGFSVYFSTLKSLIYCILAIVICNAFLYYIYYSSSNGTTITNYTDIFYKLSIGNIAASTLILIFSFK